MRRVLAIAASVAMMLAAGDPAMAQTPNMPTQLKLPPRVQRPVRSPSMPLIKPSSSPSVCCPTPKG
jgi:hypothetical protein